MIQLADMGRRWGERRRGEAWIADGERQVVDVGVVVVAEDRVVVGEGRGHHRGGGAHRDRPGDVPWLKPGESQAIPRRDRPDRSGAQNDPIGVEEGDLH